MKRWMIISWQHVKHLDSAYGKLLATVEGTREEAEEEARGWLRFHKPVGIVEEIVP